MEIYVKLTLKLTWLQRHSSKLRNDMEISIKNKELLKIQESFKVKFQSNNIHYSVESIDVFHFLEQLN